MLTAYKKSIEQLKFYGVPYRTFINDNADMVIRYNEYDKDYTDEIYDSIGNLIQIVDVENGNIHIQGGI